MKLIKLTNRELIFQENILMTRLLGLFFVVISSLALITIMQKYNEKLLTPVIVCGIFLLIGCVVLFVLTARLAYRFDKATDQVEIDYPVRFATAIETKRFRLSSLASIQVKGAITSSSNESGYHGPRAMKGFDFVLDSGEEVHCGIYSTDYKEIDQIIKTIIDFHPVPVIDSNKKEIIWG